jgi:hypothetical protein
MGTGRQAGPLSCSARGFRFRVTFELGEGCPAMSTSESPSTASVPRWRWPVSEEADQLADRIAVLDQGRLVAHGTPARLGEPRSAPATWDSRQSTQTPRHRRCARRAGGCSACFCWAFPQCWQPSDCCLAPDDGNRLSRPFRRRCCRGKPCRAARAGKANAPARTPESARPDTAARGACAPAGLNAQGLGAGRGAGPSGLCVLRLRAELIRMRAVAAGGS